MADSPESSGATDGEQQSTAQKPPSKDYRGWLRTGGRALRRLAVGPSKDGDRPSVDSPKLAERARARALSTEIKARQMTRRGFLEAAALTTVAGVGGIVEIEGGKLLGNLLAPSPETHDPESSFYNPFPDKTANAIAQKLGITAGNFWIVNKDVMSNLEKMQKMISGF